jgi:hypothetical protein
MIVITGTKRSGTSMWMQILIGAGLPFIGERFPAKWKESIEAANPEGFYESRLRRGIYGTNDADALTGKPIDAEAYRQHAVKIFVPGVIRTSERHLHRVIASVRDFREYEDSRWRMWQMEDQARSQRGSSLQAPPRIEPLYEWWTSNYSLLVDALKRRYPLKLCAYDTILEQPERTVREVLKWVGSGNADQALEAVKPQHRTQRAPVTPRGVEPALMAVFDEYYAMVRDRKALTPALVGKLETVHRTLLPRLKADVARVRAEQRDLRAARTEPSDEHTHDDAAELALTR